MCKKIIFLLESSQILYVKNDLFYSWKYNDIRVFGKATIGVVGAGAGIGIVFAGLLGAYSRNYSLEPR